MTRHNKVERIRRNLSSGIPVIGSWMQIPNSSIAEIMGSAGYEWIAIDMEHGAIDRNDLPDLFRAIELGGAISLVRLEVGGMVECKNALDAGAAGVIVPMVTGSEQLENIKNWCRWPPAGTRGVGFSRANLFGKKFDQYRLEAQSPLLIAMIESISGVDNLSEVLAVEGLDAIIIGPYDLSASLGSVGCIESKEFLSAIEKIKSQTKEAGISLGIHIVKPDAIKLKNYILDGYSFIAYGVDGVFLNESCQNPLGIL
jgi:2-dehydro-3-deoxyglucarate aldolase